MIPNTGSPSWLAFAFAAPVRWAVSTHIDKFLVDRYFARGDARLPILVIASAFMASLNTVIFKLFAIRYEFWATTAWTGVGQALFGIALLLRRMVRRRLLLMLRGGAAKAVAGILVAAGVCLVSL